MSRKEYDFGTFDYQKRKAISTLGNAKLTGNNFLTYTKARGKIILSVNHGNKMSNFQGGDV